MRMLYPYSGRQSLAESRGLSKAPWCRPVTSPPMGDGEQWAAEGLAAPARMGQAKTWRRKARRRSPVLNPCYCKSCVCFLVCVFP